MRSILESRQRAAAVAVAALVGALTLGSPCALRAQRYTVLPVAAADAIGLNPFGPRPLINSSGQIAGTGFAPLGSDALAVAFLTGPNGSGITWLGLLPNASNPICCPSGPWTYAHGLNDAGQVVGGGINAAGLEEAFITGPNGSGGPTSLGLGANSSAHAINNAGQVTGTAFFDGVSQAYITGPNGLGATPLTGPPQNSEGSMGVAINDAGQVAGYLYDTYHPFLTGPNGSTPTSLGLFPGGTAAHVVDMNSSGRVTGWGSTFSLQHPAYGTVEAFIAGPYGAAELTGLGFLPGGTMSEGLGINNVGRVVGFGDMEGADFGFVTGPNGAGGLQLLNTLVDPGWYIQYAFDINDSGQIVAFGRSGSYDYLVLLEPVPVPEPGTALLSVTGLLAVGSFWLRSRKGRAAGPRARTGATANSER